MPCPYLFGRDVRFQLDRRRRYRLRFYLYLPGESDRLPRCRDMLKQSEQGFTLPALWSQLDALPAGFQHLIATKYRVPTQLIYA
jgi:hypothetical protein